MFVAAEVATFSLEIARALRYLHSLDSPVVHLVLTPEDVFYQADDYHDTVVLKLGNFGEARRMAHRSRYISSYHASFSPYKRQHLFDVDRICRRQCRRRRNHQRRRPPHRVPPTTHRVKCRPQIRLRVVPPLVLVHLSSSYCRLL